MCLAVEEKLLVRYYTGDMRDTEAKSTKRSKWL